MFYVYMAIVLSIINITWPFQDNLKKFARDSCVVLMESPNSTDKKKQTLLRSLERVKDTTVMLLNCPTLCDVEYKIPVMQVPWDLGERRTYTQLLRGIGVIALERPVLPLSAKRTLKNILTCADKFKYNGVLVKLSVAIRPGWAIMAMLKERKEFAEELVFLEGLGHLGSSVDIFIDIVGKYTQMIHDAGMTIVPLIQEGSLSHSNICGTISNKPHTEFGEEQVTLVISFVMKSKSRQSSASSKPIEFKTCYIDQFSFESMNERLYTDKRTSEIICLYVKNTLHQYATGPYFSDALQKFRDEELTLCSKIGSILINKPEKEFTDLVAYGEERAGKTPVLPIVILAACSPPVVESYTPFINPSGSSSSPLRIVVFTGPNTLAPEIDIQAKFIRYYSFALISLT